MKARKFFDTVKSLLPRGKAFDITQNGTLRRLFEAVAVLPDDLRSEMEKVYLDLFPETTRSPEMWERAFLVIFSGDELAHRRKIISLLWRINSSGQSLVFLEKVLRTLWDDIRIFENIPRQNPRFSEMCYLAACGYQHMICGYREADRRERVICCGQRTGEEGFKPTALANDTGSSRDIPQDSGFWGHCFYVGRWKEIDDASKEILFISKLEIPSMYKNYIEYMILRLKPVHSIAVLNIKWV